MRETSKRSRDCSFKLEITCTYRGRMYTYDFYWVKIKSYYHVLEKPVLDAPKFTLDETFI